MLDFIIVGQGIAGSVLSYTLVKAGKKVLVTDVGNMTSCSAVAAGLFNPVTGKRMVKSWNAGTLFPFIHSFYPEMEKELGTTFFHPLTIYRPFGSIEEQNHWVSHSENNEEGFVKTEPEYDQKLKAYIRNDFGGFETNYSGWLNVKEMMQSVKSMLIRINAFTEEKFSFEELTVNEGSVRWKDKEAKKIIFCEGHLGIHNPFFRWIPFSPSKGEILTVKIKNFPQDLIINKNLFVVPLGNELYKVGATFERTTDTTITEKGKAEVEEKLSKLIRCPFEIMTQEAGVRPSVPDRKPLIGIHPEYKNVGIFNGMGTKGISLSPYYASQYLAFLEGKAELDSPVNIQRYYSLYFGRK